MQLCGRVAYHHMRMHCLQPRHEPAAFPLVALSAHIMSTVAELAKELSDMSDFLTARSRLPGDDETKERVSNNMVLNFNKKVYGLKSFGPPDALALCNALQSTSLSQAHRESVQAAIDSRLDGTASAMASAKAPAHTPQKLTSQITNFLTEADWEKLHSDRTSLAGKIQVLVDRLQRLGLRYAHEQTVKWAVAILVVLMWQASGSFPEYSAILGMVHDFKATMDACRKPFPHGHLLAYPSHPKDLPEAFYAHAYDKGDQPVSVEIERLANTAESHIPLRSSSSLLRSKDGVTTTRNNGGAVTWDQLRALMGGAGPNITMLQSRRSLLASQQGPLLGLPSGSASSHASESPEAAQGAMRIQDGFESMAVSPAGSPPQSDPLTRSFQPRLRLPLPPPAPEPTTSGSLGGVSKHAGDAGSSVGGAGGAGGNLTDKAGGSSAGKADAADDSLVGAIDAEAYEEAALKALEKRAGKRKIDRSDGVLKRPAAEATSSGLMKKPASANIAIEWLDGDADKPRGHFTSKWYHKARNAALAEGKTRAEAALIARAASKEAGEMYNLKAKIGKEF